MNTSSQKFSEGGLDYLLFTESRRIELYENELPTHSNRR